MVPQSGRKGLWPDNRFSMNPALPDSLYHSAAQPDSMRAFVGGAVENAFAFSQTTLYHNAAQPGSMRAFSGGAMKNAVAFFPDDSIP